MNDAIEVRRPFWGKGFRPPISGVLQEIRIEGGETYFVMREKNGKVFMFASSLDLHELIQPADVGCFLVVKLDADSRRPKYSVWSSRDKQWRDGKTLMI